MCYSQEASLFALVFGTLINLVGVVLIRRAYGYGPEFIRYLALAFGWQWVLMMQLSEYLIWTEPNGGTINSWGTVMAKMFNITQPFVVFLALYVGSAAMKDIAAWRVRYAAMIIIAYLAWTLYVAFRGGWGNDLNIIPGEDTSGSVCIWSSVHTSDSGHPERDHHHKHGQYIYYPWWQSARGYGGTNVYFATLYPIILLLLPLGLGLFTAGVIAASMFVSAMLPNRSRYGKGSAWCLYVLVIIALNPLAYLLLVSRPKAKYVYEEGDERIARLTKLRSSRRT